MAKINLKPEHEEALRLILQDIRSHNELPEDYQLMITIRGRTIKPSDVTGNEALMLESTSSRKFTQISTMGSGSRCPTCDGSGRV